MSESRFWSLVEISKGTGGDIEHTSRLANKLRQLSPQEVIDFQILFEKFRSNAETGPVWAAGTLLNDGHGTDSGFEYFRNWLIGQGQATYEMALKDPDSLAAVSMPTSDRNEPFAEWESFGGAAYDAYEAMTGREIYADMAPVAARVPIFSPFDWHDFDDEFMVQQLPRLWEKYGARKQASDKRTQVDAASNEGPKSVIIEGLGVLSVGDYVTHSKFGPGKVMQIFSDGPNPAMLIVFDRDGRAHPMIFTKDHLHLWSLGK